VCKTLHSTQIPVDKEKASSFKAEKVLIIIIVTYLDWAMGIGQETVGYIGLEIKEINYIK